MLNTDLATVMLLTAQLLFVLSSFVFAVSAVDDLIVDIYFYVYLPLKNKFSVVEKKEPAAFNAPEKYIAIMLPAWQESNVIEKSVVNIMNTMAYTNYHVFVGIYPNDRQTEIEVERLTDRFDKVHKVVTKLPGPTCKADCLNCIVKTIMEYEQRASIIFEGFVLQDAEDIVHKLSLKIFNYYLDDYDLIQIPVYSLKRNWNNITGGHYMDEFAEFQGKEIRVREKLANLVPGAGVGTAYSRRVVSAYSVSGAVFNTNTLTEDYEFSLRMHANGFKQVFARIQQSEVSEVNSRCEPNDFIATREYFPSGFWASVRQKTRWTIGISLQGWNNFKWIGNWRIRFFLWRDRKMLFFAQAIATGFFSLAIFSSLNLYHWLFSGDYQFAPLLDEDSAIWHVVYFNLFMLIIRILQRFYWTYSHYGLSCLLLLPVRYMWGAVINYLAISRAITIYLSHLISGKSIGWDKTSHDFPEEANRAAAGYTEEQRYSSQTINTSHLKKRNLVQDSGVTQI